MHFYYKNYQMKLIDYHIKNLPVCFFLFYFIITTWLNAQQDMPALIPLPHKVEWE